MAPSLRALREAGKIRGVALKLPPKPVAKPRGKVRPAPTDQSGFEAQLAQCKTPEERLELSIAYVRAQIADMRKRGLTDNEVVARLMDYDYSKEPVAEHLTSADKWVLKFNVPQPWQVRKETGRMLRWMRKYVNHDTLNGVVQCAKMVPSDHAYWAHARREMGVDEGMPGRTYAHEFGHALHDSTPGLKRAIRAFFTRRMKGVKITKNWAGEMVRDDGRWYNPYVGRIYSRSRRDDGDEVLSTGLEAMYHAWRRVRFFAQTRSTLR
ncbi:MAG: hypothetical protein ACP5G7_12260 [Anaerolineae bacterium]